MNQGNMNEEELNENDENEEEEEDSTRDFDESIHYRCILPY